MEISNKDKKLLVYLFSVGIVALVYFFVGRPNLDKHEALLTENEGLKTQISHYNDIYSHQEEYENQIVNAQVEYGETLDKFFGGLNQENTLMNIKGIEDATNTWVSRVSFQDSQIMIGSGESEAPSENIEGDLEADASQEFNVSSGELTGMKQDLNLEYSCSYSDFKRFIEYIQNYDQRLFISSINASYSVDTNQVSGTMVLSQYAILGSDKEYTAPDLSNIGLGVDNIFSTLKSAPKSMESQDSVQTLEESEENAESEESDSAEDGSSEDENTDNGEDSNQ